METKAGLKIHIAGGGEKVLSMNNLGRVSDCRFESNGHEQVLGGLY